MYKLLTVNGVAFPIPEGDFSMELEDKFHEYEGEDGSSTVELIRRGIRSVSVSYNGLPEVHLKNLVGALRLVSEIELYNPMTRSVESITGKVTGVKTKKIWYQNNQSLWSLAFQIEEL